MTTMLNRTYLPYQPNPADSGEAAPNLTMIHGWAADNGVWQEWVQEQLAPHFNVYLIELPGFGQSPAIEEITDDKVNTAWLEALAKQLPEKTHLLGWSLGGLMTQQLALNYPDKIQSLICMASTPRFTQNDNWKLAVSPPLIIDFIKAISIEAGRVLKQFWSLQLQGSDDARSLIKRYRQHMSGRSLPKLDGLLQGLTLLKDIDNRSKLKDIQPMTLWLLGEHDPLIPKELVDEIHQLQPSAQVHILEDASHMPFFSHPDETAAVIVDFIKHLEKA